MSPFERLQLEAVRCELNAVCGLMTSLGWAGEGESVKPCEAALCALQWWRDELENEELRRMMAIAQAGERE